MVDLMLIMLINQQARSSGAAVIDGGLGVAKNLNIGGNGVIAGRLDVDNTQESTYLRVQ